VTNPDRFHTEVRDGKSVRVRNAGSRVGTGCGAPPSTVARQSRDQAVARFVSRLAVLRSVLNRWWTDTDEGNTPPELRQLSEVRDRLAELEELSAAIGRARR